MNTDKKLTYTIPGGHLTINLTQLAKVLAVKIEQKLK